MMIRDGGKAGGGDEVGVRRRSREAPGGSRRGEHEAQDKAGWRPIVETHRREGVLTRSQGRAQAHQPGGQTQEENPTELTRQKSPPRGAAPGVQGGEVSRAGAL